MAGQLPGPTSDLVGREDELARLVKLLVAEGHRLVTVTGLGGSGKTRLALEAARQVRSRFSDGVSFVDLSALMDDDDVAEEIGRQLEVASLPGRDPLGWLSRVLVARHLLMVVDNVEQVADASSVLGKLVASCPRLTVLVTSRRRLRLRGERVIPLAPLRLPERGDDLRLNPAVRLFCDRADAVDPLFEPDDAELFCVAEICRRLDGLPLALELAAARTRTLPPRQLLDALTRVSDEPWVLLDAAPVDAPERHRSLLDAVTWSVDLLAPFERALFRRLGVFSGPWSVEAAQLVCSGSPWSAAPNPRPEEPREARLVAPVSLYDALSTLVDLHLVEPVRHAVPRKGDESRFKMLDTIAAVARTLLDSDGEVTALRRRHADCFLQSMLAAGRGLESADEARWFRRIDAESRDLEAALTWMAAHGQSHDVVVAAAALGPYWLNRARFASASRWLAVDDPGSADTDRAAARGWELRLALDGQAEALASGEARGIVDELTSLREVVNPEEDLLRWLRLTEHLSYAHRLYGDPALGQEVTREALARCTGLHLEWWRAEHLLRLALLADQTGDTASARRISAEALTAAESGGNDRVRARAKQAHLLSTADLSLDLVVVQANEILASSEAFGDRRGAVTTRILLGSVAWESGHRAEAARHYARAVAESVEIGYQHGVALTGVVLVMEIAPSDWRAAATLHGALSPLLPTTMRQFPAQYGAGYEHLLQVARDAAGVDAFDAAVAHGSEFTWDESVALVLAEAGRLAGGGATPTTPTPSHGAGSSAVQRKSEPLTAREVEVLRLIAAGHTNQQIGHLLFLSPKTVMHHSGHIYRKLGVRGRAEAVARAGRSGLLR